MDISRRGALAQVALAGFINLLIARLSPAEAQNAIYSYDALGRLTGVTYQNGATVAYTYDAAGNRTQVVHTPGSSSPPPPPPPPPPLPNGTVVFDSSTPGNWSWTAGTTQNYEVKVWGPGAGGTGMWVFYDEKYNMQAYPGGGGGGGGYCLRQFSVTQNDTLGGRIGAGGAPVDYGYVSAGSEATTLASYQSASLSAGPGNGSSGGTASGGTTNTNGRAAGLTNVTDGGGAGNGGGDQTTAGANGTTPGGGGAGDNWSPTVGSGRNGRVLITAR